MQTHLLAIGFAGVIAASGLAQALAADAATLQLVENTGAVDRGAAGNGSMGMGEGIGYPPQGVSEPRERGDNDSWPMPGQQKDDEPGHAGNETDMEHRGQYDRKERDGKD